jgi:hypothetical protein
MRTVKVTTVKNNPTYTGEVGVTYDKVFLPSKEEMFYTKQASGEGTYFPVMKAQLGLASPLADYKEYPKNVTYALENHSSAQLVRLRSASPGNAYSTWFVGASGYIYNDHASYAIRACPVCVIG